MKRLAVLISIILLGGILVSGCSQEKLTQAPKTKVRKKLTVGGVTGNYPFQMADKTGGILGYNVDLCDQLSKYLNTDIEFQNYDSGNNLILALQANKVDFAIAVLTITEKRKEVVDFSNPYIEDYACLAVSSKHKDLKGWEDIDRPGMTLAISQGSYHDINSQALVKQAEIRKFEGGFLPLQAVANGQADAIIDDATFIKAYAALNPGKITILDSRLGTPQPMGIAVTKGNKELLDKINAFLKQYQESGAAAKNYDKWFNNGAWKDSVLPPKE